MDRYHRAGKMPTDNTVIPTPKHPVQVKEVEEINKVSTIPHWVKGKGKRIY